MASSLLVYLMAKSSTTRANEMGLVWCFQRPPVRLVGAYPNGARNCLQAIVGKLANLGGEAIHTFSNFQIDIAVVDKAM